MNVARAAHRWLCAGSLIIVANVAAATAGGHRADAQVIGAHVVHVPAREGRRASLGIQAELGTIVWIRGIDVWPSIAGEYQRQENLGPGRWRVAAELRLLPGFKESRFHPYLGGSLSANRSGGEQSEWPGALLGLQGIAGVLLMPSDRVPVAFLLEERFGYVREQDHATATHIGLVLRFR